MKRPAGRQQQGDFPFSLLLVRANAFLATLLVAAISVAEAPRIAVAHSASDAAARRLVAEVRNVGFYAVDIGGDRKARAPSRVAEEYRAVAVLTLGKQGSIDVAVVDPDTKQVVYESLVPSKGGAPASLRAVEELHGRLVELHLAGVESPKNEGSGADAPGAVPAYGETAPEARESPFEASPGTLAGGAPLPPAPADADAPLQDRGAQPSLLHLQDDRGIWLAGSLGFASTGLRSNAVPETELEVRAAAFSRFSVSAFALLPFGAEELSGFGGSADVRARVFGGALNFIPFEVGRFFFASTSLGGGIVALDLNGHSASSGFAGRDSSVLTPVGLLAAGLGVRALPWLSVRANATGGLAAHRPVLGFEGQSTATWGPGFVAGTLGLEMDTARLFDRVTR